MENKNLNIPNIAIDELVESLSTIYTTAVKTQTPLRNIPTPFLWGPPGVGKSQGVRLLAEKLAQKTGKKVEITDVRLLLYNPIDLRGMPTVSKDKTTAVWLKPRVFAMDDSDDVINLLFLDELSASPPSVQACAYQICLDRKVGEHQLPHNCIVIAAGNRTTDQSVSLKMPKALCNRLMHFNVETQYTTWLRWAKDHDIDSRIIGYLAFDNSKLCVEPGSSDMAYTSPRSWEHASNLIKLCGGDLRLAHPMICGVIGTDTAIELETWANTHAQLPTVDDVFSGCTTKYPTSQDALLAFSASLVSAIRARRDRITTHELENACAYVRKFPTDFAMTFYTDLNAMEDIRLKLMKCPSCQVWLERNKQYL